MPPAPEPTVSAPATPALSQAGPWRNPWFFIALIAIGLAGWQWFETRTKLTATQKEVARRLAESDTVAKESRALAKLAQEQMAALQGKYGELDGKIAESKSQQATLETLYKELTHNREEWTLSEIEQSVTLASQQLQLAGNVRGAILALQSAETRLTGESHPQFITLRKALTRDLERVRALPQVDLPGMSVKLESVISAVDALPLAVHGHLPENRESGSGPKPDQASMSSLSFWKQLVAEFWGEFRSLIRIQRFDREEPALLAPGQEFFLRENLKLRLHSARLALLAHDQWAFRHELKQVRIWIERYFDGQDVAVRTCLDNLKQLSVAAISIELPSLNESLSAIKTLKSGKDRK